MNMHAIGLLQREPSRLDADAPLQSAPREDGYRSAIPVHLLNDPGGPADARVSFRYLSNYFGEGHAEKLITAAGLRDETGRLPQSYSKAAFWQLCLDNINLINDEGQGCTKQPLPKATWSVVFAAINQMETVDEGLRRFAELAEMVPSGIDITVGYGDSGMHLNLIPTAIPGDLERLERYIEVLSLAFHCALLWITAKPIVPTQVRLSSLLDDADGSMLSYLAPRCFRHGAGVTIVYDRKDTSLPLGVRKYKYWGNETAGFVEFTAQSRTERAPRTSPVVEKVGRLLATSDVSQPEAARAMGMSVATLQRHLREEGVTFRELSRQVRRDKLITLLATDGNLDDVAMELGFSERRSLWRACQDWLGVSPTQFRERQRKAAAGTCADASRNHSTACTAAWNRRHDAMPQACASA